MRHYPGKFNWFEHRSADPRTARQFYESLLGWQVRPVMVAGNAYDVIHDDGEPIGAVGRADAAHPSQWRSYLSVEDVDRAFESAVAAGAAPVTPPHDIAGLGRSAAIRDPGGVVLSLWRAADGDRADTQRHAVGDWYWNELHAADAKSALAFYQAVFGYTHEAKRLAGGGHFHILKGADGKPRGRLLQARSGGAPMWMPYVHVEVADETAARVGPLGGKLTMAPHEVPAIGRIGALLDPTGAALGFIQPAVVS